MSETVKVKVRPEQTLAFPALCVNCSRPATEQMTLKKRRGRLTRLIDVPICDQCAAEIRRQSGEEERLERIGRLVAVVTAILALIVGFVLTPSGMSLVLRLLIAAILAGLTAFVVLTYFRQRSLAAAHPEKLAILASASLTHFSWRATTFCFENIDFARSFASMNESRLMEAAGDDSTES